MKAFKLLLILLLWGGPLFTTPMVTGPALAGPDLPSAATYYVSSSSGSDSNSGLAQDEAFATVSKVNSLNLQPGDQVRFKCGDIWRADPLVVRYSGLSSQPILFGSYPAGCANQPVLSGAQPVSGWALQGGNIFVADLSAGANAARFPNGVNQLFRGSERLPLGRWPNMDEGDAGYSTIDSQSGSNIVDSSLPAGNWAGAVAHIRGMRWYILNRLVNSSSGTTLNLAVSPGCWGGSCAGWGYFLNNHLGALDRDGEWFYDSTTRRLYLYSTSGLPSAGEIEGSVILNTDDRAWGGVNLGLDLTGSGISYVTIENFNIQRWFRHGIASPTNLAHTENHDLVLLNNSIQDVDSIGISLMTWVYNATDGGADGWRGGHNLTLQGNTIDTSNRMGISSFARNSILQDNQIRDVGLIENLGRAGMGCAFDAGEGQCTEDGDGIRILTDKPADSGNWNTIRGNRLERIAYNGMDIFGHHNTIHNNAILQACYSKGDCGGVRTFGRDSLSNTPVYDLTFDQNVIVEPVGNTDGCHPTYQSLFGFGFYIDNYSRNIQITDNTVISSTVHGVLYQNSTGRVSGNTLYNNGHAVNWAAQVWLTGSPTNISEHTGNILFGLNPGSWTFSLESLSTLGSSDDNAFFSPYRTDSIRAGGNRSLASWQAYSGKDAHSSASWYTQSSGEPPRSRIFYNDTPTLMNVDLGARQYLDLDQNPVLGSFSLQPYSSRILIDDGPAALTLLLTDPSIWGVDEAAPLTIEVFGAGFTAQSVLRWGGVDRVTTFISSSRLRANLPASDLDSPGEFQLRVYDPSPEPAGTLSNSLTFKVVEHVDRAFLPGVFGSP